MIPITPIEDNNLDYLTALNNSLHEKLYKLHIQYRKLIDNDEHETYHGKALWNRIEKLTSETEIVSKKIVDEICERSKADNLNQSITNDSTSPAFIIFCIIAGLIIAVIAMIIFAAWMLILLAVFLLIIGFLFGG